MNILEAYKALFGIKQSDEYKVLVSKNQGLKFVREGKYTLMEQNPHKSSVYADLARQGHNVAWLFEDNKYKAVVIDGVIAEASNPMIRDLAVALALLSQARSNTDVYTSLKKLGLQI